MPKEIRDSFDDFEEELKRKPITSLNSWNITALSGDRKFWKSKKAYRLRISDYRFVILQEKKKVYIITDAGSRGDVYKHMK